MKRIGQRSMQGAVDDVAEFMAAGQQPTGLALPDTYVAELDVARTDLANISRMLRESSHTDPRVLRLRLIVSEVAELAKALYVGDLAEVEDALVDIDYVTVGAALTFGYDHAGAWGAVHRSNMAKFVPGDSPTGLVVLKDAQGKVLKPEGWRPPDLTPYLPGAVRPTHVRVVMLSPDKAQQTMVFALDEVRDPESSEYEPRTLKLPPDIVVVEEWARAIVHAFNEGLYHQFELVSVELVAP